MGSQNEDLDISQVHIIFQRHGQAISNIVDYSTPGVDGSKITMADLRQISKTGQGYAQTGIYLPDGLTQFGLDISQTFIDGVTRNGTQQLDNVYMLATSPLTRSYQTIRLNSPAFNLVGPFHIPGQDLSANPTNNNVDQPSKPPAPEDVNIYCHPGLQEATTWPQDFPGVVTHDPTTSLKTVTYLNLTGGATPGKLGTLTGEHTVDVTKLVWPSDAATIPTPSSSHAQNTWETLPDRMAAVTARPFLKSIEAAVRLARVWLRECAKKVLIAHRASGRSGTPRIVVCVHGGIINFITQKWYCKVVRGGPEEDWVFAGSAKLGNLECAVYRFSDGEGEEAGLEEVPIGEGGVGEYYRTVLGKYYKHLGSDEAIQEYVNPDGSVLDQKAGHWNFILDKAEEVQGFAADGREVLEALVMWKGVGDFLAREGV